MEHKFCNKCQSNLELTSFRQCKYPNGNLYYKSICKKCESKIQVARIKKNGTNMTEEQKRHSLEYKKEWKILNRKKLNKDYRDRLSNDINFRLRKNVSRAMNRALKKCFLRRAQPL